LVLGSGFTDTFGNLKVGANSILDFPVNPATGHVTVSDVTFTGGSTLTVNNWVNSVDYFYSTVDPSGGGTRGSPPLNQILYGGTGANTAWQSYNDEITPVPEPGFYGALMSLLCIGAYWARRQRTIRAA
jgi:hypothetical protein